MTVRQRSGVVVWPRLLTALIGLLAVLLAGGPVNAVAGWSPRAVVDLSGYCDQVALGIDADGRPHVFASCEGLRYAVRTNGNWTSVSLATSGFDFDAQLAIDGSTIYIAYTHNTTSGCGDSADAPGVYYRSRSLPDGDWSAPRRIGALADVLQSFRVVGGTLHATVRATTGRVVYETNATGTVKRYAIPGAVGRSSLRVGSDGRARIAYEAATSLRVATFTGSAWQWASIPGTTDRDGDPVLVLDGTNRPHVVWQHRVRDDGGCAEPDDETTLKGTYYATNTSGAWTPTGERRITANLGDASLTLDTETGRVHIALGTGGGTKYYAKLPGGSWSGVTISSASGLTQIRLDQERQRLFVVIAGVKVFALSKP